MLFIKLKNYEQPRGSAIWKETNNSAYIRKIQYNAVIKIKSSRNVQQHGEVLEKKIGSGGGGKEHVKIFIYNMNQIS